MIDLPTASLAVIYARVSDDGRQNRSSVSQQETECAEAVDANGWTLDRTFADNDRSASRYALKEREEYAKLLDYLATSRVDVLILWESSRGGRELEGWAGLLNLCRRRSVRIHVVTHRRTYDLENPRDWRTLAEDGVDSAYESEKTRERILRSVRANASKGLPHGKLLYGYRRTYDDRGNFIAQVAKEPEASIVREAARRVAEGESCYSIANDFNERGIPSPRNGARGWILGQVKRIVVNPGYAGLRVHRGVIVGKATWEGLLDDQTYNVCLARLNDEKRKTLRDPSLKHLLSGVAFCGVCGSRLRLQKNRGHFGYICHEKFHVSIKREKLEGFITALVIERLSSPDALALLAEPATSEDPAALASAEAREKRGRLDGFYAAAAKGEISPTGLAAIEASLLPEIAAAEERARVVAVPPLLRGLVGPDAEQSWARLGVAQQREVVTLLMDIRVDAIGRGKRTFDPTRLGSSRWRGDTKTWAEHWRAGESISRQS